MKKFSNLLVFTVCLVLLLIAKASAENPFVLIGREESSLSTRPQLLDTATNGLFFIQDVPGTGRELWTRDETSQRIVRDINPGSKGAFPEFLSPNLVAAVADGRICFLAENNEFGKEIWCSNGSPEGTGILKDITIGESSTHLLKLHLFHNRLLAAVRNDDGHLEIWLSDIAISTLDRVFVTPSKITNNAEVFFTNLNSDYYLTYINEAGNMELWRANLQTTTPIPVQSPVTKIFAMLSLNGAVVIDAAYLNIEDRKLFSLSPLSGSLGSYTNGVVIPSGESLAFGDSIAFFAGQTPTTGIEIWRTGGSHLNTAMIASLTPGSASTNVHRLVAWGDRVIVLGARENVGSFLWASNAANTSFNQIVIPYSKRISNVYPLSASYFLIVAEDETTGEELWYSNGTTSGTALLADIAVGLESSHPTNFARAGLGVYLTGINETGIEQLWYVFPQLPPTAAKIRDLSLPAPERRAVPNYYGESYDKLNDYLLIPPAFSGDLLYSSRGTPGTTEPFLGASFEKFLTNFRGTKTFLANPNFNFLDGVGSFSAEVWRTDGSIAGTQPLASFDYGSFAYLPEPDAAEVNSYLLVRGAGQNTDDKVLLSGEVINNTASIQQMSLVDPRNHFENVQLGPRIFFAGYTPATGVELWATDGTNAGTDLIKDAVVGPISSNPTDLTILNGEIYYFIHGDTTALMKTNGTTVGTSVVKYLDSLYEITWPALIHSLFNYNGHLYFFHNDSLYQRLTLWKTTGTVPVTTLVSSNLSTLPGTGQFLGVVNNRLLFISSLATSFGLWATDGTSTGTDLLAIGELNEDLKFEYLIDEDKIYFSCSATGSQNLGTEPCISDGTVFGTDYLTDIEARIGSNSSYPANFTAIGNQVFFTAYSTGSGRELWRIRKQDLDTRLVLDLNSGPGSSNPTELVAMGDNLIFRGSDGEHGVEIWGFSSTGDQCPDDPTKMEPGICGCNLPDLDSDGDSVLDCLDECPADPAKATNVGACGCGASDADLNANGLADCFDPDITQKPGRPALRVKRRTLTATATIIPGVRYEFYLFKIGNHKATPTKRVSRSGKVVFKNLLSGQWKVRYRLVVGELSIQRSPFSAFSSARIKAH